MSFETIVSPPVRHWHIWTRSGTIYRMHAGRYTSRATAHRAAARIAAAPADRLVLECPGTCPQSVPSRRPRTNPLARLGHPHRVTLSHRLAERLNLPVGRVRGALDDSLDSPRPARESEPDASPDEARAILKEIVSVTR